MTPSISERLAEMLSFLRRVAQEFEYYSTLLSEADKRKVDLLHYLELNATDYRERCKIATQLRLCLLERRSYKDLLEERSPIAEFLAQPQNKGLLDKLARVLGASRKVERYHRNRSYIPRILPNPTEQLENKNKEDLDNERQRN